MADNTNDSNLVFNWAEKNYPEYFSPANTNTMEIDGYLARYYSGTQVYLGTKDNTIYAYGTPFGGLMAVGSLSEYTQSINSTETCNSSNGTVQCTFYVATDGSDNNMGTFGSPFASVEKAISLVNPGDIIYVRGGTYELTNQDDSSIGLLINKSGSENKRIKLWAYPGESVEFVPQFPNQTLIAIQLKGDYWYFKGFSITGIKQWLISSNRSSFNVGFDVQDSDHNIFEQIESHHNEGIGFYLGGHSTDNLILNCDFHHNGDPLTISNGTPYPYGHADGIHIRVEHLDTLNTVRGTRAWNNSDDGFDTWYTAGIVKFEESWAFFNGYEDQAETILADGNGFKLGPMPDGLQNTTDGVARRIVKNCLAYHNLANGFDYNGGQMPMQIYNNSSYRNGQYGYTFDGSAHYDLKNNISYANDISINFSSSVDASHNSWNGFTVDSSDFFTLIDSPLDDARNSDGSLPTTDFLHLKDSSDMKNAGVHLEFPYSGLAPDLGY